MCAGCNVYEPWAALLIGLMAGKFFVYIFEAVCLPTFKYIPTNFVFSRTRFLWSSQSYAEM